MGKDLGPNTFERIRDASNESIRDAVAKIEPANKATVLDRAAAVENLARNLKQQGYTSLSPDDLLAFAYGMRRAADFIE